MSAPSLHRARPTAAGAAGRRRGPRVLRAWLLPLLLVALGSSHAASPDDPAAVLQDLLSEDYYVVEFFVFERPALTEQLAREQLALNRPRALPARMRTQRLDPEYGWDGPIDELTRACMTFPTVAFELAPAELPPSAEPSREPAPADAAERGGRPVPRMEPRLEPHPQLAFMARLARFEQSLADAAERWLPEAEFVLGSAAARVTRSGLGRVLFHGRWLQAVPPRDAPLPVLIQAGATLSVPNRIRELEGTVGVTLGRYLHFQADLYYHEPGLGLAPAAAWLTADGGVRPVAAPAPDRRYMRLAESTRMRSTETHYLDHPKLGVVVRIDPVTFPDELIRAYVALQESVE